MSVGTRMSIGPRVRSSVRSIILSGRMVRPEHRAFLLRHVRATDETVVSILGQNDEVLEYKESIPTTRWQQTEEGLLVSAMRAQRIYNDRTWANPVVLKIANPEMELR